MSEDNLFAVSRISNGWLITIHEHWKQNARVVYCSIWPEVEKVCRNIAFPYPNKDEPRGPA